MHSTRLVKCSLYPCIELIDAMRSSSSWVKPVQFSFWKFKHSWKGIVNGAMGAVILMLIGKCFVLGIALRTPFLHTPAILSLERVIFGLYLNFHLPLLIEGGCLLLPIRLSLLVSAIDSTASLSRFVSWCYGY